MLLGKNTSLFQIPQHFTHKGRISESMPLLMDQ
jgi:hypothetical protein